MKSENISNSKPFEKLTKRDIKKLIDQAPDRAVPDPDNPEWTKEDFKRAVLTRNRAQFDAWREKRKRGERGPQKAPTKARVSIRLDTDIVAALKAGGRGWQTRLNDLLRVMLEMLR